MTLCMSSHHAKRPPEMFRAGVTEQIVNRFYAFVKCFCRFLCSFSASILIAGQSSG